MWISDDVYHYSAELHSCNLSIPCWQTPNKKGGLWRNKKLSTRETGVSSCCAHINKTACGKLLRPFFDDVGEVGHLVVNGPALFHQIGDFLIGIHDRGVVPIEQLPDLWKRQGSEFPT